MLRFLRGDLFDADAEAFVNPVNCVGVMGKGLAFEFKQRFPENFEAYRRACVAGEVRPGRMFVFETNGAHGLQYVVNFPTKRHWREPSRMEDIESGLAALVREIDRREIRSIAIPALGCGLGGLEWSVVRGRIEDAFTSRPDLAVTVFEPASASTLPSPHDR